MTFKNLVPDTRYALSLQCKFQASDFWSDIITVHEKTLPSGKFLILTMKRWLKTMNLE